MLLGMNKNSAFPTTGRLGTGAGIHGGSWLQKATATDRIQLRAGQERDRIEKQGRKERVEEESRGRMRERRASDWFDQAYITIWAEGSNAEIGKDF